MAGRLNVTTGALPSTYGVGAWNAQGSSKNYRRPMGKDVGRVNNSARFSNPGGRTTLLGWLSLILILFVPL